MSIASEISRLTSAKSAIAAAITNKGVVVPGAAKLDAYPGYIAQIEGSGGTPSPAAPKDVNFYDYDGTLLYSYTVAEANALTALPTQPTHAGLTGQGWNYTLAQVKAFTRAADVGATYITSDGKTHLHVRHTVVTGLDTTLYFSESNTATLTVDWGDGKTDTSSTSGNQYIGHTYDNYGDYVIKMWISNGTGVYGFGNGSSSTTVIGGDVQNVRNTLRYAFIGNRVTSIGDYAFQDCYSLTSVTIPDGVTSIGARAFRVCYSLTSVTIPDGVTRIETRAFQHCYSLTSVTIPDGVTSIVTYAFQYCYSLISVTIPDGVTSIGTYAFNGCYSLKTYLLLSETPPTLANVNAFTSINAICKMYVPDESVNLYKTATNWITYADYIYPMSEYEGG